MGKRTAFEEMPHLRQVRCLRPHQCLKFFPLALCVSMCVTVHLRAIANKSLSLRGKVSAP